jgi:hypothetical protein
MIDDILNAVMAEAKALLSGTGGTVILKTDFLNTDIGAFSLPLLLIDLTGAPDTYQMLGGASRVDWNFSFNSYHYMTDPMGDDQSGYSRSLLAVIDTIRQHFSKGQWLNLTVSPTMGDLLNNYCFKYTLSGIEPADGIERDGMKMGYKIVFDCVGIDNNTNDVQDSTQTLLNVVQINNPPFN